MLRQFNDIQGLPLIASDGDFGRVRDVLVDTGTWIARYVLVDSGSRIPERAFIVPPSEIEVAREDGEALRVSLTQGQIEKSPLLPPDRPVSRQEEERLHTYFGWQPYWVDELPPESHTPPVPQGDQMTGDRQAQSTPQDPPPGETHLRSSREMVGYHVQANDGQVGRVSDMILDDESWAVRYFVIDAGEALLSKKLLLAAHLIDRVSFDQFSVFVDLEADQAKGSPEFDPTVPVDKEYEEVLRDYFGY